MKFKMKFKIKHELDFGPPYFIQLSFVTIELIENFQDIQNISRIMSESRAGICMHYEKTQN
jgi:hypothetical protein